MIRYIIADDRKENREAIHEFLQFKIEAKFGDACGTTFGEVDQVLEEIKEAGADLRLIVVDLDFYGNIPSGGLKILSALTPQQRRVVVVYSSKVDEELTKGMRLSDEINASYEIPLDRIVSTNQGSGGLWLACASVLSESQPRR
ncbi:MAG TPA: hypothetical protein VNW97_08285 [Candidatus Saccharimonadales bacterium]|nr:hypothetical protein [Candidatus Saccharimonadales bacterium]